MQPPNLGPLEPPNPSNYPRAPISGISASQFIDAVRTYYRSLHILWGLPVSVGLGFIAGATGAEALVVVAYIAAFIVMMYFGYRAGLALGRSQGMSKGVAIALCMALSFVGLIGIAVIQTLALNTMRSAGVVTGCFRPLRRKDLIAHWQYLCHQSGQPVREFSLWAED